MTIRLEFFLSEVQLIYNVLISAQQNDSVIYIYIYILFVMKSIAVVQIYQNKKLQILVQVASYINTMGYLPCYFYII